MVLQTILVMNIVSHLVSLTLEFSRVHASRTSVLEEPPFRFVVSRRVRCAHQVRRFGSIVFSAGTESLRERERERKKESARE